MAEKMVLNHKKSVQKGIVQKISALCKEIWELTGDECYFVALNKGTLLQTGTRKAVTFIQQNSYFLQALKEYCDKSCSSRKRRWKNTENDIQKRGQNHKHMEDQIISSVYKTVESSYQSVDSVFRNKDSGNQSTGNVCETEYSDYKSVDSVCKTVDSGYQNTDNLCKTVDSGYRRMDSVCKTVDYGKQSTDSGYQSIYSVCKTVDSTYQSTDSVCKITYSMSKTGDCVCKIVDSGYHSVDSVCKVTDNVITDYLYKSNYNTCNTTGCISKGDVCSTANSLCKTTHTVCKSENMNLNTDNVCKTADMNLNTDIVCKDSCQSPCEDNLEDFEDIIPFMLEGTEESEPQEDFYLQNELFPNNQLTVPKEYGVQWSECMPVRPDTLLTAQGTTEERVIVTESDKLDYFCKRVPRSYPPASRYKRRKRKR